MPEVTLDLTNKIVHETSVDFVTRKVMSKIYLMQYDDSLPVIKVNLLQNGQPYSIPNDATVYLRYTVRNGYWEDLVGIVDSDDSSVVYFVTNEMLTAYDGPIYPIIKIMIGTGDNAQVAGSSYIDIYVNRNPIQDESFTPTPPRTLAAVAFSGDYNDLKNKPSGSHLYRHVYHTSEVGEISWNYSYIRWDIYSTSTNDPSAERDFNYPMTVMGGAYLADGSGYVKMLVTLHYDDTITVLPFDTYYETTITPSGVSHEVYQVD